MSELICKKCKVRDCECVPYDVECDSCHRAYQQGAKDFAEWLEDNDLEFRCSGCKFKKECGSESADNTNLTCVEFVLAEWQKGTEE